MCHVPIGLSGHSLLRSYRAASHNSTGVPPHKAPYGRATWTKLPKAPPSLSRGEEMKIKDQQSKDKMKRYADHRKHAKPSNLVPSDQLFTTEDPTRGKHKLTMSHALTSYWQERIYGYSSEWQTQYHEKLQHVHTLQISYRVRQDWKWWGKCK